MHARIRLSYDAVGISGYTTSTDTNGGMGMDPASLWSSYNYIGYTAKNSSASWAINNLTGYKFEAKLGTTSLGDSTIYNENSFKKPKALGLMIFDNDVVTSGGDPDVSWLEVGSKLTVKVGLFGSKKNLIKAFTVDADGWGFTNYIHTGKQQTYTVGILDGSPSGTGGAYGYNDLVSSTIKQFAWGGNAQFITQTMNI